MGGGLVGWINGRGSSCQGEKIEWLSGDAAQWKMGGGGNKLYLGRVRSDKFSPFPPTNFNGNIPEIVNAGIKYYFVW